MQAAPDCLWRWPVLHAQPAEDRHAQASDPSPVESWDRPNLNPCLTRETPVVGHRVATQERRRSPVWVRTRNPIWDKCLFTVRPRCLGTPTGDSLSRYPSSGTRSWTSRLLPSNASAGTLTDLSASIGAKAPVTLSETRQSTYPYKGTW